MAMRGIASHAGRRPPPGPKAPAHKTWGNRRSGRAGEPAVGAGGGVGSLDDAPHRPQLPSCPPLGPTNRPPDLYEVNIKDLWYYSPTAAARSAFRSGQIWRDR